MLHEFFDGTVGNNFFNAIVKDRIHCEEMFDKLRDVFLAFLKGGTKRGMTFNL